MITVTNKTSTAQLPKPNNAQYQPTPLSAINTTSIKQDDTFGFTIRQSDKLNNLKALYSIFVNLTPQNVKDMKNKTNKEAAKYCYDLICKSMKIPNEIAPEFIIKTTNKEAPGLCGLYTYMTNELSYFSESAGNTKLGKWWTFGLIRHEMEHFRQNIDILRSKELSEKLFEYYDKTLEDVGAAYKFSKQEIQDEKAEFRNIQKSFQSKILKYYPPIQAGTKEYKHAEKMLNNRMNYTLGTKGISDKLKYFIQPSEFEACRVQGFNWINYLSKRIKSIFI